MGADVDIFLSRGALVPLVAMIASFSQKTRPIGRGEEGGTGERGRKNR